MRHEYTVIRLLSGTPCLLFRRIIISAQQTAQPAKYRQFEGGKTFSMQCIILQQSTTKYWSFFLYSAMIYNKVQQSTDSCNIFEGAKTFELSALSFTVDQI